MLNRCRKWAALSSLMAGATLFGGFGGCLNFDEVWSWVWAPVRWIFGGWG